MVQTINILSDKKNICEVEYFLNEIFHKYELTRKIYCKIYLSLTEAAVNAIVHGNSCNINKSVTIIFCNKDSHYEFIVEDEGFGFNYDNIPDPTHKNNINNESGRGIFIMKQYADKLIYKNNGSKVVLIFNK